MAARIASEGLVTVSDRRSTTLLAILALLQPTKTLLKGAAEPSDEIPSPKLKNWMLNWSTAALGWAYGQILGNNFVFGNWVWFAFSLKIGKSIAL